MSLVVRELVIRATVEQGPAADQGEAPEGAGRGGAGAKQDVVAECVDQVLQILRESEDR